MRMSVSIATGLLLAVAVPASAHLAEGTVTMTAAEEVPAPVGVPAGATGTAELELEDDNTLTYNVTVSNLSGPAMLAHIHEGAPGVPGGIIFGFTKTSDTTFAGTTVALTPDQVTKLLSGAYYVNVHTAANGAGEIRGQITTVTAVQGTCSCQNLSKQDFRKCVNAEIRKLDRTQRRSPEVKALKKAVKKSSCGLTQAPRKKQAACCQPANDVAGIVTGELCQPVKSATQCKTGEFIDSPCAPTNPCSPPASPSGAFVD